MSLGKLWCAAGLLVWHSTSPDAEDHNRPAGNTDPLSPSLGAEHHNQTRRLYLQRETRSPGKTFVAKIKQKLIHEATEAKTCYVYDNVSKTATLMPS